MTVDFVLPPQLAAREPAELRGSGRDDVRLLVSRGDDVIDAHFRDLPRFLTPGDLLVLNTTATLPAAITAIREDGDAITLHFSTPLPAGLVVVEPRQAVMREGERLVLPGGASVTLLAPYRDSARLWIARFVWSGATAASAAAEPRTRAAEAAGAPLAWLQLFLALYGRPITYSYIDRRFPLDAYQTVFATDPGSAEMPSAGRAFTRAMLACLRRGGVRLAKLVLHAGVASLENHEGPYEELYEVPARTAEAVRRTKARGGRVVAVGTTVVRALESSVDHRGVSVASRGWTDLVITPEHGVRIVDGLLTGFHEPRATHLAMLEAIAGRQRVEKAYAAALAHGYLWHEFGDLHLIL